MSEEQKWLYDGWGCSGAKQLDSDRCGHLIYDTEKGPQIVEVVNESPENTELLVIDIQTGKFYSHEAVPVRGLPDQEKSYIFLSKDFLREHNVRLPNSGVDKA